jgi:hypothetical protein
MFAVTSDEDLCMEYSASTLSLGSLCEKNLRARDNTQVTTKISSHLYKTETETETGTEMRTKTEINLNFTYETETETR